jgi:hypothetical protein
MTGPVGLGRRPRHATLGRLDALFCGRNRRLRADHFDHRGGATVIVESLGDIVGKLVLFGTRREGPGSEMFDHGPLKLMVCRKKLSECPESCVPSPTINSQPALPPGNETSSEQTSESRWHHKPPLRAVLNDDSPISNGEHSEIVRSDRRASEGYASTPLPSPDASLAAPVPSSRPTPQQCRRQRWHSRSRTAVRGRANRWPAPCDGGPNRRKEQSSVLTLTLRPCHLCRPVNEVLERRELLAKARRH